MKSPYLSILPELLQKRKVRDALLAGSVVLLAGASFGLGRLSVDRQQVALCSDSVNETVLLKEGSSEVEKMPKESMRISEKEAQFVASQTGSAYYALWCAGASRIKPENKTYFATKEEAEQAGYVPAKNCKGM